MSENKFNQDIFIQQVKLLANEFRLLEKSTNEFCKQSEVSLSKEYEFTDGVIVKIEVFQKDEDDLE